MRTPLISDRQRQLEGPVPLAADLNQHLDPAAADALLLAAGRGDQTALGTLFDRTAPVLYGRFRRVLTDPLDAARAAENVFVELWRRASRFKPGAQSAHSELVLLARFELIRQHHNLDRTSAASIDGTHES